jgi:CBS domain-containing protein
MREMREEVKAEEQKIAQERAQYETHLELVAVLRQKMRELPSLPPAVTLGPHTTVRNAIEVMRQQQISCVLVVDQGQLVGVFTERDVVTKVAATSLDVDRVRLSDVMRPDPESLSLDDELLYALHQMHIGEYRHVPVLDEQQHPTALVSIQMLVGALIASLPQELLNLPPSPAHSAERAPTPEGG